MSVGETLIHLPCSLLLSFLLLQKPVFENVPLGTVILRVRATDADSGSFALIQYSLGDGEGKFGINPNTVSSEGWSYTVLTIGLWEQEHLNTGVVCY